MKEQKDKLERIYQKLNEEEDTVLKKWYESIIPKIILLFPSILFALTFLKVNTDKSILDLLIPVTTSETIFPVPMLSLIHI